MNRQECRSTMPTLLVNNVTTVNINTVTPRKREGRREGEREGGKEGGKSQPEVFYTLLWACRT